MTLSEFKRDIDTKMAGMKWYRRFSTGVVKESLPFLCFQYRGLSASMVRRILFEADKIGIYQDTLDALLENADEITRAAAVFRGRISLFGLQKYRIDKSFLVRCAVIANKGMRPVISHVIFFSPEYQEIASHYHADLLKLKGRTRFRTFSDTIANS